MYIWIFTVFYLNVLVCTELHDSCHINRKFVRLDLINIDVQKQWLNIRREQV
jgi:hypothetical protein